ncbi:hypothetical protein F5883DRAFT_352779, partial [Diaporthe sp. PMI_573]
LRLWSPPQDPDKPRLPYLPGLALQIDRHVPPGSSEDRGPAPKPHLSQEYLESLPQSEIITANPPIETAPPANPERARLEVTTPIAIGASRGAQVVGCTIFPQPDNNGKDVVQPFQAAAKIYDPLYYNFKLEGARHARDVVFEADNDYSNETRAYEHLLMVNQTGSFAPAYYGSWTFSLPISIRGRRQTRSVRLILIERLHGTTIAETRVKNHPEPSMGLDSFHYPEEFRLEVLARALEGFATQQQTGLDQRDFAGSNVLLAQDEFDSSNPPSTETTCGGLPLPRVVLIDYNHARINLKSRGSSRTHPHPLPLPENPASISLRSYIYEGFSGWVPREWEDEKFEREWLAQRF